MESCPFLGLLFESNSNSKKKKSEWIEDRGDGLLNLSPPGLWSKFPGAALACGQLS